MVFIWGTFSSLCGKQQSCVCAKGEGIEEILLKETRKDIYKKRETKRQEKKERFCKLRMETAYKKKMEGCMKQLVGVFYLWI